MPAARKECENKDSIPNLFFPPSRWFSGGRQGNACFKKGAFLFCFAAIILKVAQKISKRIGKVEVFQFSVPPGCC